MNSPQQFPFAQQSAGPAPLRRPGSIRRTTSIDSDWPDGLGQPWVMTGRARDLLTPLTGDAVELAAGEFRILASPRGGRKPSRAGGDTGGYVRKSGLSAARRFCRCQSGRGLELVALDQ